MQELILSKDSKLEDNIFAIIGFIKELERENGLTDEEIVHKYTCGHCCELALDIMKATMDRLYGNVEEISGYTVDTGDKRFPTHTYLKLKRSPDAEDIYFDIMGAKTIGEIDKFTKSNFWKDEYKKPWVEQFDKVSGTTSYLNILASCYDLIKMEGLTIV